MNCLSQSSQAPSSRASSVLDDVPNADVPPHPDEDFVYTNYNTAEHNECHLVEHDIRLAFDMDSKGNKTVPWPGDPEQREQWDREQRGRAANALRPSSWEELIQLVSRIDIKPK